MQHVHNFTQWERMNHPVPTLQPFLDCTLYISMFKTSTYYLLRLKTLVCLTMYSNKKNRNRLETQSSKFLFKNITMLTIRGDKRFLRSDINSSIVEYFLRWDRSGRYTHPLFYSRNKIFKQSMVTILFPPFKRIFSALGQIAVFVISESCYRCRKTTPVQMRSSTVKISSISIVRSPIVPNNSDSDGLESTLVVLFSAKSSSRSIRE
jgi:hypothetical protein